MILTQKLVEALDNFGYASAYEDTSYIQFNCKVSNPNEVNDFFMNEFKTKWIELRDQYDNSKKIDLPTKVTLKGKKITYTLIPTSVWDNDNVDIVYDDRPLKDALQKVREKYPDVVLDGYVVTIYADYLQGQIILDELSKPSKKHPLHGEILRALMVEDADDVSEEIADNFAGLTEDIWIYLSEDADMEEQDFKDLYKLFATYSKWLDDEVFERLIEVCYEQYDDLAEKLQERNERRLEKEEY